MTAKVNRKVTTTYAIGRRSYFSHVDGNFPINASGGLIGLGHPVGATGVRMALDCAKQFSGRAGAYQIPDAQNLLTFNMGGSTTTCASLVVGVGT